MKRIVLYLYIFFVCYVPIIELCLPRIGGLNIAASWLIFYILAIAFMLFFFISRQPLLVVTAWPIIYFIYVIVVFASVYWSNYHYDVPTLKGLFITVFVPFLITLMALQIFFEKDNVRIYVRHIVTASIILSSIAIYQFISGHGLDLAEGDPVGRASATFHNANGLAIFLVLTIPSILYALRNHILSKLWGWVGIIILVGGVLSTVSRKGIVSMSLVFLLFFALNREIKKTIVILMLFLCLGSVMSLGSSFSTRFNDKVLHTQFSGKAAMALAGWHMFLDSPIIGLGYKGYYENFGKYYPGVAWSRKYDAHNMYVSTLADYGLLGLLPFVSIFLYPLYFAWTHLRKQTGQEFKHLHDMAVICICAVVSFMISGYFAGYIFYDNVILPILFSNITFFLSARMSSAKQLEGRV